MVCPHCEGRPLPYLMQEPWELDPEGTNPALYVDDPEGGEPLIVASIKRIHRPDILQAMGLPRHLPPPPDWCGEMVKMRDERDALRAEVERLMAVLKGGAT